MARIERVGLYRILVEPASGVCWEGIFGFHPSAKQVAEAMRLEISELDEEIEHEHDVIQAMRQTLQLVTFMPELLGKVEIAGTYVGEIRLEMVQTFGLVEEAMMPALSDAKEPVDLTDLVKQRVEAGQFGRETLGEQF